MNVCGSCGEPVVGASTTCGGCGGSDRFGGASLSEAHPLYDTWPAPASVDTSVSSPSRAHSRREMFVRVLSVVTAVSTVPAAIHYGNIWFAKPLVPIWFVGAILPSLLVVLPVFGSAKIAGFRCSDSRLLVLVSVSALMVGLRSAGGLASYDQSTHDLELLTHLLGLPGFAVSALVFPSFDVLRRLFGAPLNPVHIVLASIAALQFFLLRSSSSPIWSFVFSPGSVSGPNLFEYGFLTVLVAVGFLRTPWRHFAALPLALFSAASFTANVMLSDLPLRPWPNPVTFACCVAILFPLGNAMDRKPLDFQ